MDEDSTLNELQHRIGSLKDQRSVLLSVLVGQRRQVELMQTEMSKMKKEKVYLQGLIKQKVTASRQYDRIIAQSQRTIMKLSENTKKLLLSVDNQYGKYLTK